MGHKTASVVMSQGFGHPAFPIDTHIHRLAQRWGLTNGKNVVQTEKDLKAGDLVFWKGHVAMMIDNLNIIHANAFHMKTAIEPLSTAKKRILKSNGKIKKLGRL